MTTELSKALVASAAASRWPVLGDAVLARPFVGKNLSEHAVKAFLVVVGSLLLAVSAQFKIPLYPVPVTGQTLLVLLIGMAYGPRRTATVAICCKALLASSFRQWSFWVSHFVWHDRRLSFRVFSCGLPWGG